MSLQNYAKFDSRSAEWLWMLKNKPEYNMSPDSIFWQDNYYSSWILDNLFHSIWFLALWIMTILLVLLFFLAIWTIVYIIIILFTKWWNEWAKTIKNIFNYLIKFIVSTYNIILNFLIKIFRLIKSRLKLVLFLILAFIIYNFTISALNWTNKLLKVDYIDNWYVWVDLKNDKIINSGYYIYTPLLKRYFLSPTSLFDFEIAEVTANTNEELLISLDYRVSFLIDDSKRLDLYKKYWSKSIRQISSDIVMPKILENIKWVLREYSFKDISKNHNEIKWKTLSKANLELNKIWISVKDLNIIDIRLPKSYIKSKEDLLNAENEKRLAEARLDTERKKWEADIIKAKTLKNTKIISAEAISEYNKIVSEQIITDSLIKMKELENEEKIINKWNWVLPKANSFNEIINKPFR